MLFIVFQSGRRSEAFYRRTARWLLAVTFLALILLASMLAAPAFASAPPAGERAPFEALDYYRLEHAVDPRISPDGAAVVFLRDFKDITTDLQARNLWWVGSDGRGLRRLTDGVHWDASPRWSPDGRRIAFVSDRGGSPQIWILRLADGRLRRLTELQSTPWGIAWSPDGRRLAFVARVVERPPPLVELPRPPPGATWAEPAREIRNLIYKADGVGFLEPGVERLFVVDAEGAESSIAVPRRATRDAAPYPEAVIDPLHHLRDDGAPAWTPDGRFLLTAAPRRAGWERDPIDTEIWEVSLDRGTLRPLTDRRGPDLLPAVSPDGRHIAYVGFDDRRQTYQVAQLWLIDRQGGAPRSLTAGFDRDLWSPRWAADGESVAVLHFDRGETRLSRVGLDGRVVEVARRLGEGFDTYGSGTFTLASNGVAAFPVTRPDLPSEVAVARPGESGERLLTSLNTELLAGRRIGEVEELWLRTADGLEIQAWVLKPPDFDPARRWPLILDIHGGPFRDYGPRFDLEKQIWAGRGYLVLYANPRGSAGYGERFGNAVHHAYPGEDAGDLEVVVDAVVARGWADPENLFVTGGSGGGILALALVARSDRFRAAASLYTIAQWTTFTLTSDYFPMALDRWFPGPPWEHAEHYRARSPFWMVDRIDKPVLFLAGENDLRTPPSEAEQLYRALKLRGVDTMLVRLPGEPHFLESRPSHAIARMLYTVGWFDRHRRRPASED